MTRGSERAAVVPGIDLVKPVLALLVIWIHTAPLARIAPTVNTYVTAGAARLAVPLYLAISGYLLFRRPNPPVRRQLRRVLELYLIWLVLYLPVIVPDQLSEGLQGPVHLVRLILTGGMTHLWYLPSVIIGIVVVSAGLRVTTPGRLLVALACLSAVRASSCTSWRGSTSSASPRATASSPVPATSPSAHGWGAPAGGGPARPSLSPRRDGSPCSPRPP